MYLERDLSQYFQELTKLYPVVLVTGPRQTGKTSFVRKLAPNHNWVLLDRAEDLSFAKTNPSVFLKNHPLPIILDEIQKAEELFSEIKYLVDKNEIPPGSIILTGSQPLPLMKNVSESLAGRVGILELPVMTPAEINDVHGRPRFLSDWLESPPVGQTFSWKMPLDEILLRGGFPAMALPYKSQTSKEAALRIADYFQTYLTKDLRELAQVQDLGRFSRFVRQLSIFSGKSLPR